MYARQQNLPQDLPCPSYNKTHLDIQPGSLVMDQAGLGEAAEPQEIDVTVVVAVEECERVGGWD